MTEGVIASTISTIGIVLAAVLSLAGVILSARANSNAKRARVQVENNHTTNLREEGDERHTENAGKLDEIIERLDKFDTKLGRVWRRLNSHDDAIADIENTQDHPSRFAPQRPGRHREEPTP